MKEKYPPVEVAYLYNPREDKLTLLLATLVQLLLLLILALLFANVAARLGLQSSSTLFWICACTPPVLCYAFMVQRGWLRLWYVLVPHTKAVILHNPFVSAEVSTDPMRRYSVGAIAAFREHQGGIHGKWPWSSVAYRIDLRDAVIIGTSLRDGTALSFHTKEGSEVLVEWSVTVVPLPGFLVHLVGRTPQGLRAELTSLYTWAIFDFMLSQSVTESLHCHEALRARLRTLLGEEGKVSVFEATHGVKINLTFVNVGLTDFSKRLVALPHQASAIASVAALLAERVGPRVDLDVLLLTSTSIVNPRQCGGLFLALIT